MPFWKLIGCLLIFSVSKVDVSIFQMNRTLMVFGVKFMSYLDRILMSHSDLRKIYTNIGTINVPIFLKDIV
jgi:hypothetical protein